MEDNKKKEQEEQEEAKKNEQELEIEGKSTDDLDDWIEEQGIQLRY